MTRQSENQHNSRGDLVNGYDYQLQVWVVNGIIQNCGHPESMRPGCCNADKLQGKKLADIDKFYAHFYGTKN